MQSPFQKKGGGQKVRYVAIPSYATGGAVSPADVEKRLNDVIEKTQETPDKPHNPEKIMDESRKTIAYWFVISFIIIVAAVLLLVPIYNAIVFHDARVVVEETSYQPLDIAQVLTTLGTLLGAPLGFVVGYYFKEEHSIRNHGKDRGSK